jgi:thymidylate synthase (FAD)
MKLIKPAVTFLYGPANSLVMDTIEYAARTCYQSFDKAGPGSAEKLIRHCIQRGHESVLEHMTVSLNIVCDRGVTHELVRHRVGVAYSQESTRYVRYDGEMEFIEPWWWGENPLAQVIFTNTCRNAENSYKAMVDDSGLAPQAARAVLPNALKTEIVVTANFRAWRHIFKLRRSKAAHPDMRIVMDLAFDILETMYPVFFEDMK